MALKGKWTDKTDGIDIASAEDINSVAHAVMDLEDEIENVSGVYVGSGEMPEWYNIQVDPDGDATLVEVGDVVTLDSDEEAYVTSENEDGQVVLNFGIPRGENGESAEKKPWTLIDDHTIVKKVAQYEIEPNGEYTEVFIEAVLKIYTEETSATSIAIRDGVGAEFVAVSANVPTVSNGTVIYHRANGGITPDGKYMFDTAAGKAKNTATVSRNCSDPVNHANSVFTKFGKLRVLTSSSTKYQLDEGSTIKIWGR